MFEILLRDLIRIFEVSGASEHLIGSTNSLQNSKVLALQTP